MKDGISVVVPAFGAQRFIDECLASIQAQDFHDYEVLVGIDGCPLTLDHIKKKAYADNVRFFYFQYNQGPYVIKNSLLAECRNKYLLFFDADDVMLPGVLSAFHTLIQKFDLVKLPYINFTDGRPRGHGHVKDDAVFGVHKEKFEEVNGFYGWVCSADTEFSKRTLRHGWSHGNMPQVAYHRRIHNNNLTVKPETNYNSNLRKSYDHLIKRGRLPHPDVLAIQPYKHVENTNA